MAKLAKSGKRSKIAYITNDAPKEIPVIETVPASIVEPYCKFGDFAISSAEYTLSLDCSRRPGVWKRIYQIFRFIFTGKFTI